MHTYTEQDEWAALKAYAADGDPRAFEVLVLRYQAMVYATCRRQLGNTTDAEDATQETFLKLAHKAAAIRSSLSAWLHTCAVGTCKDLIRSSVTRRKHEHQAGKEAAPSRDATWDQLGPVVDDAMQSLQSKDRELIVQRFFMGMAQTEIAEQEGVSPSAIHQRVDRAVEKLRRKLRSRGLQVASVALGTLMTMAAQASVPQTVTASAMQIGVSGIGSGQSVSVFTTITNTILEASLMTKLTTTGIALALVAGTTVTVNQLRSASPPSSAPNANAPAAIVMAEDPQTILDGVWENSSWKIDNEPATGAKIQGNRMRMHVPSFIPGGDRMEMTLEILETEPDAKPGKIVYKIVESNSPMVPITGEEVVASYAADDSRFKLAINFMGGERPDDLEQGPGRWVLACYKDNPEGSTPRMADGLDPNLAGNWSGFLPMNLVVKDGVSQMKTASGDVISESEVVGFDPNARPMKLEVVVTMSTEMPALVGTKVRHLVDLRGDRVRYANYDARSPRSDQYPRDFKGKKGDQLNVTVWRRVDEK